MNPATATSVDVMIGQPGPLLPHGSVTGLVARLATRASAGPAEEVSGELPDPATDEHDPATPTHVLANGSYRTNPDLDDDRGDEAEEGEDLDEISSDDLEILEPLEENSDDGGDAQDEVSRQPDGFDARLTPPR